MMSRIFPSWEEIHRFHDPLEPGEQRLAEFLDEHLPADWEIYVQPFLNGDRPDIVILNPAVGAMIYEVKDWDLRNYTWDLNQGRKRLVVSDGRGSYEKLTPIAQVNGYRENIIGLYIPDIGERVDHESKAFGVIKTGVYFHNATGHEARELMYGCKETIIGYDDLTEEKLAFIVPDVQRSDSIWMTPQWAKNLQTWLRPPYHAKEQNLPLVLNKQQREYAEPEPGHRRLRGVAGSGKTAIVAWRAAKSASQGRRVLVVCFNITLTHYIRDMVQRCPFAFDNKLIEYRHFHGFCKNVLSSYELPWPNDVVSEGVLFREVVPQLVLDTIRDKGDISNFKYDAILIDEGQDFYWEWYDMLCHFLSDRDELLLVADKRQNIFQRDLSWLEGSMHKVKFRGPWRELKQSMRLPPLVVEQANRFARQFVPHDVETLPLPSSVIGFADPKLWWANCESLDQAKDQMWAVYQFLTEEQRHQPTDIIFLLPSHEVGLGMVARFERANVRVNHVFDEQKKSDHPKHHKHAFWMGDPRLKMSTIHSFKGWELTNVVLIIPPTGKSADLKLISEVYTALTRMTHPPEATIDRPGCLVVLNCHPDFCTYGEGWPNRWEIRPVNWPAPPP
jgi:hypothetical protein